MDISLLKQIKMLISDVDGVMTDGTIWLDTDKQWKRIFSVYDGVGMKLLMEKGYQVGVITGGKSEDVKTRMEFLGIPHFYDGVGDKVPSFEDILKKTGLKANEIMYIGDEIFDIPLIERVGVGVSVPNGVDGAKSKAKYITKCAGGTGAVREICDWLLKYGFYS
ncbi:MAG: KdsC family phosphatase [Bdellovibrionales bacterium]